MGKPTGFIEYQRESPTSIPAGQRINNYQEFTIPLPVFSLREQAARCMDCGVPFCHVGCPIGNVVPDFNDLAYRGEWKRAIATLHATNNFPEITGRVCPAPCEESCVLAINAPAVTIKNIEKSVVERAFGEGWVRPEPPESRTGKAVAVVGSGPAGLACAAQLNRAGHSVTVYERADRIGGLLRYGIPDFKLDKSVLDRRLALLSQEGVRFEVGVNVGVDVDGEKLRAEFDAIVLCGGATRPRDLDIPGRELAGVHFAMDYLSQQNRRVAGDEHAIPALGWWFDPERRKILANGRNVIVIGGGDTGSDCIGTANRQGAASITQFEVLGKPPEARPQNQPWPYWPTKMRTSTSHDEGCERYWGMLTRRFIGEEGKLTGLETVDVEWTPDENGGPPRMREVAGSERTWPTELTLLAVGFTGPETNGIVSQLGVQLTEHGTVAADEGYMTNQQGVFVCGDMRRGQSLVVWAISEGREAARGVDRYLMGATQLPTKDGYDLPSRR